MSYYIPQHKVFYTFLFLVALPLTLVVVIDWNKKNESRITESNSTGKLKISNNKTRLNVIILTHMSSGSTIVGNIFNFHPDVFYVYEPLHSLRRLVYGDRKVKDWSVLNQKAEDAYKIDFSKLLRDVFTCSFQESDTIQKVFPGWVRRQTDFLAWRSPTTQFTKNSVRDICNSRRITVLKIMQNRLPGEPGMRELQKVCSSGPNQFECLIIHLVRDPRAVLSSLIRRKFFVGTRDVAEAIKMHSAHVICSTVEENLIYANAQWSNWFKGRYMLVRYEDSPGDLLRAVLHMYNFTSLPMVTSISKWISQGGVLPGVKDVRRLSAFSISLNDVDRIDHWRFRLDTSLVSEFEEVCWPMMYMMGYISVNGSERLLHDTSQKLWTKKIPFHLPWYEWLDTN